MLYLCPDRLSDRCWSLLARYNTVLPTAEVWLYSSNCQILDQ